MSELRFYFDESVELAVSEQLAVGKIDVVSAHSLEKLGDEDVNHLQRATEMGRILCTYDNDFLVLATEGVEHAGIVYAHQQKTSIGDWVRGIRALHTRLTAEEIRGQVVFLSLK